MTDEIPTQKNRRTSFDARLLPNRAVPFSVRDIRKEVPGCTRMKKVLKSASHDNATAESNILRELKPFLQHFTVCLNVISRTIKRLPRVIRHTSFDACICHAIFRADPSFCKASAPAGAASAAGADQEIICDGLPESRVRP